MKLRTANRERLTNAARAVRSFLLLLALAAAGIAFGVAMVRSHRTGVETSLPTLEEAKTGVDELDAAQNGVRVEQTVPARGSVPVRRSAASVTTVSSNAAPGSSSAQQAMAELIQLDSSKPLTAEQASAAKHNLQALVAQGPAAIPVIQQFLQQNKDLSLDETKGGSPTGYPSLRAGLFDALRQIGGPEAQSTLADLLRSTGDPSEIGLLAKYLEDMAPGQFKDEAVKAAREVLAQAEESKSTRRSDPAAPRTDVAPLFEILQTHGDASVVADLQKSASQWKYYGLMSLAGLPEGQGIPALIEQAQQAGAGGVSKDTFAVQMLAQVAAQNPDASAALLEQTKSGQIPDRAWRRIADALAGDQYQFLREPNLDSGAFARTPGLKTYHIEAGNENFYSIPLPSSDPSVPQRRALIDQLLGANSNPAAATALQQARALLGPR